MRGNKMSETPKTNVSGIFRSQEDLAETINYLEEKGIPEDNISVLMPEKTESQQFSINTTTKIPEKAFKGFAIGSLIGAVIGGLMLIGVVIIPRTGLVVSGPIISLILGAAIGGIIGSIIGASIGRKIPEYEAKFFKDAEEEKGNILLVINIEKNLKQDIEKQFSKYGALNVISH
jgi:hypothetical protein